MSSTVFDKALPDLRPESLPETLPVSAKLWFPNPSCKDDSWADIDGISLSPDGQCYYQFLLLLSRIQCLLEETPKLQLVLCTSSDWKVGSKGAGRGKEEACLKMGRNVFVCRFALLIAMFSIISYLPKLTHNTQCLCSQLIANPSAKPSGPLKAERRWVWVRQDASCSEKQDMQALMVAKNILAARIILLLSVWSG